MTAKVLEEHSNKEFIIKEVQKNYLILNHT